MANRQTQIQKERADRIADQTAEAYSRDSWGESWRALALFLVRRGFADADVVGILCSKHTRWCDECTVASFKAYMQRQPEAFTRDAVRKLWVA